MSIKDLADQIAAKGRYGDEVLVHMTKGEVAGLQGLAEAAGGSLTINPETGQPEAFFLAALLPTILGAAAPALGAAATGAGMTTLGGLLGGKFGAMGLGALTGALMNRKDPIAGAFLGGIGGAGGAGIGKALTGAGQTTAQLAAQPVAEAAGKAATEKALQDFAARQAMAEGAKVSGAEAAQMAMSGQVPPPVDLTAPNLDAIRNQAMGDAYMAATPQGLDAMGRGIMALGNETGRDAFMQSIGGGKGLLRTGYMAAAPMVAGALRPRGSSAPTEEEDTEDLFGRYEYRANPTGGIRPAGSAFTGERVFFQPEYRRMFAAKGGEVKKFADGGEAAAPSSDAMADPAEGMTGMSRDAMLYLYGMAPSSRSEAAPTAPYTAPEVKFSREAVPQLRQIDRALAGMDSGGGDGGSGPEASGFSGRGRGLDNLAFSILGMSQGPLGRFSPVSMIGGKVAGDYLDARADYIGNNDFGTLNNAQNISNIAYGGLGTFSDQYGNVGTFSSPQTLADYDASWSGGDSGGGSDGGFGYGGVSASDTGDIGFGGGSLGGFAYSDGGITSLARGGMKAGGFVIPADVVSMVGEGNTDAGYEQIKRMLPGATPIKGKDGGQADTVATSIEGKQPARIAHGEMYVPPAAVKRAGGAKKLYAMMKNVRKQAKGDDKQIKPVNLKKAMA